jgi:hypothetical protein
LLVFELLLPAVTGAVKTMVSANATLGRLKTASAARPMSSFFTTG